MFSIGGVRWNIRYVSRTNPLLRRSDGVYTLGVTDLNSRSVFIAKGLGRQLNRKVLIHEVCHAAMFSYGIRISLEEEEFVCDFVASHGEEIISVVDSIFGAIISA